MVHARYVGGEVSELGEIEFDTIGQRATLSEKGFREVILGGAAFLPQATFDRVGFTEEELQHQGPLGQRYLPHEDFCNKLAIAHQFYRELRQELEGGKSVEEVLAPVSREEW